MLFDVTLNDKIIYKSKEVYICSENLQLKELNPQNRHFF